MFLHICDIVCCIVFVDFLHLCFVFHLWIIDGERILSCPGKVGGMPPTGRHQGNSRRQRLGGKLLPGSKIYSVGICFLKISMRQGFKIDAPQSCNFVGRESLKIHVGLCLPNHLNACQKLRSIFYIWPAHDFTHTWVVPGNDPYNLLGRFFAVATGLQKKTSSYLTNIIGMSRFQSSWKWKMDGNGEPPKACGGISTRGCADTWKKLWSSVVGWDSMTMKNSHPDLYCKFLERIITRI